MGEIGFLCDTTAGHVVTLTLRQNDRAWQKHMKRAGLCAHLGAFDVHNMSI